MAERPGPSRGLLLGLVGRGIAGSRTPAMHEAEARRQGLVCIYRLLDVDAMPGEPDLATILRAAEIAGFDGLNVTFPYKVEILDHLDELAPQARDLGAVNTVVLRGGRRVGHNTDVTGFAHSVRTGLVGARRERVLLVGAGGAGAAVAHALVDEGVGELVLADAQPERAQALAERLARNRPGARVVCVEGPESAARERLDGIVNATPVGMAKHPGLPVPAALLRPDLFVVDIVYLPLETALLTAARRAGCRVLSGAGMAVGQAADAFALFSGRDADHAAMRATFESL